MVNSYLHVGVEYGLPVLVAVMILAVGIWMNSWGGLGARRSEHGLPRDAAATIMIGAGSSWLVFLIANVFSTLWIFRNLWWLPAADGLVILASGWMMLGGRSFSRMARAFAMAAVFSLLVAAGLYTIGKLIHSEVRITYQPGEGVVVNGGVRHGGRLLIFPEASVLGEDWGKEIRRLARTKELQNLEIETPLEIPAETSIVAGVGPQVIVACGSRFPAGIAGVLEFPQAHLILLHPRGTPVIPAGFNGKVTVILPMLDTKNSGRGWKIVCKRMGWNLLMSPGVGQDVRLVWPSVLTNEI